MRELTGFQLLAPVQSTTTLITGGWVDVQGIIGHGHREIAAVLQAGVTATQGTCGGTIQSATSTAGAGLATVATFTTLTSAGGLGNAYGVLRPGHRYVRYLGTIQSAKFMILACHVAGKARVI